MLVHKREHLPQAPLTDERVGVEQQHILATRLADGNVVGLRETLVVIALYERDATAEALAQILHSAVARVVVHHNQLALNALSGTLHAEKALLQVEAHTVAHYYY